ncbi:hypothetical protein [Alkalitalea saponilacus]|uniref:hypothetical protein n=1 Tax=Alkalitalea saponilacus TaxID=889453 RepID=UPI0009A7D236|nr:hypothetical protein [Alkalitalea saponilacus]ASB50009.1 hypothetical protein CDL62_13120 [Alkalitalea saponilacus]
MKATYYDNPGDAFRANVGVYEWNHASGDWDKTGTSNKIELHFPSVPEGLTNDAAATFEYKGKAARTMPGEELPELLAFSLSQNNEQLISYKMTASYNSDDMPTNVKSDLSIESYTFTTSIKYNSKDISVEYALKENSNTIIELKLNAKGDFDPDNLMMGYDEDPSEFVNSANVSLQIADIKILGQANVKKIADALDRIYKDEEEDDDFDYLAAATQEAKVLNDNAKLIVVYAGTNNKFAETEFYVVEDSWWGEHYVDLQLIFADESRGDFEAYFGSAFNDIIEEILKLLEELGIDFDDWDNWDDDDWDDWEW